MTRPQKSAGPDASGEGFEGAEAEFFVKLNGGVIDAGDSEGKFVEFERTEGVNGGDHKGAAESVALVPGNDAELGGVADAWGNFTSEDGTE